MWRSTDTGLDRVATFVDLVSLFRRPIEPVRECATRGCSRASLSSSVALCERCEIDSRLTFYDPGDGWTK